MSDAIFVKNAILHILDNNINIPVLSNTELDLEGETSDFLTKHIDKLIEDANVKNARFIGDKNKVKDICSFLSNDTEYFVHASKEIAEILFDIMLKNVDISPADLILCLFDCDGQPYFGILKLNYKTGFTHFVQMEDEGNSNSIIRHKTILPSDAQKIDECVFINLNDLSIKLIEKAYEINGAKEFYLSKLFLNCTTELSDNEKLKILDKVTQKINRKFFDEDHEKAAKLKKAVSESFDESSTIEVDIIADEVFENNLEIRNEYISEIQKAGLTERSISIPEKLVEKKYRTHKIQTDNGIEIQFPSSYCNDSEKLEFINNPDGTISILIKRVGKITNK